MNDIIFIASLDHSGSTMLDLMLGSHSQLVGLGEVELVWKKYIRNESQNELVDGLCSCGSAGRECSFWSKVFSRWDDADDGDYEEGYRIVLLVFNEVYGDGLSLVDSSKYLPALRTVTKLAPVNLKAVHLLKDVRAFTISRLDRAREKRGRASYLLPFKQFASWHRINKKFSDVLHSNSLDLFRVGYEEICLNTVATMQLLLNFVGVNYESSVLFPGNSSSHCLLGNRMRLDKEKSRIIYDARWLTRTEWLLPSILLKRVMQYNYTNVYSNDIAGVFQR